MFARAVRGYVIGTYHDHAFSADTRGFMLGFGYRRCGRAEGDGSRWLGVRKPMGLLDVAWPIHYFSIIAIL